MLSYVFLPKFLKMVQLDLTNWPPELKLDKRLLSLRVLQRGSSLHGVFFPYWCFTWSSFPAGVYMVYFPCWCFTNFLLKNFMPWQPNKMATFHRHLASHNTITSTSCISSGERSRAIWPSCFKFLHH